MVPEQQSLVSVVIPCYNHEKYVCETIQSVIDQDYSNIELIIIDDGSSDDSVFRIREMVPECEVRFVRFEFRHRQNKGLASTLNESLTWVEGKYFTGIASDDVLLPNKISLLVKDLEIKPASFAVSFGDARFINGNSEMIFLDPETGNVTLQQEEGVSSFAEFYKRRDSIGYKDLSLFGRYQSLLLGNYLPAMGYLLKTNAMRDIAGWTDSNAIEDWEMWLKLSKLYRFSYVNNTVALYRLHGENSIYSESERLTVDSIRLLSQEKCYALSKGFRNEYYAGAVTLGLSLIRVRPALFVKYCLLDAININYMRFFLKKIINILLKKIVKKLRYR